jgi:hypothetical protein
MSVIEHILVIYSWAVIGVLLVFLWRIAYFYEKTSGQRVGHRLFFLPSLLLGAGALWYLVRGGEFVGEPIGDTLLFFGGALLSALGFRLYELMTGSSL